MAVVCRAAVVFGYGLFAVAWAFSSEGFGMNWLLIIALALAAFAPLAYLCRHQAGAWQIIAVALLLGLTGYALQGQVGLAGAPQSQSALAQSAASSDALIAMRLALADRPNGNPDHFVTMADAMTRHGQFADAIAMLNSAVASEPNNDDAWLALANNLVSHADGGLSPAALLAFRRAEQADPAAPGPKFFLGLALIGEGRVADGRALWQAALDQGAKDAPWRDGLAQKLARLDTIIAMQSGK
jgi:cytochrome c-type biogenesis protein CcmH